MAGIGILTRVGELASQAAAKLAETGKALGKTAAELSAAAVDGYETGQATRKFTALSEGKTSPLLEAEVTGASIIPLDVTASTILRNASANHQPVLTVVRETNLMAAEAASPTSPAMGVRAIVTRVTHPSIDNQSSAVSRFGENTANYSAIFRSDGILGVADEGRQLLTTFDLLLGQAGQDGVIRLVITLDSSVNPEIAARALIHKIIVMRAQGTTIPSEIILATNRYAEVSKVLTQAVLASRANPVHGLPTNSIWTRPPVRATE